ncbi:hypothetical protein GJ496_000322 [Pomphorhynchus laevis]|nr:hypothetical protein GJ496_000322 [Pomphorhynchus laevis]
MESTLLSGVSLKKKTDLWLSLVKEKPLTDSISHYRNSNEYGISRIQFCDCIAPQGKSEICTSQLQYNLNYRTLINLVNINVKALRLSDKQNTKTKISAESISNIYCTAIECIDLLNYIKSIISIAYAIYSPKLFIDNESIHLIRMALLSSYPVILCSYQHSCEPDKLAKELLSFVFLSISLTKRPPLFLDLKVNAREKLNQSNLRHIWTDLIFFIDNISSFKVEYSGIIVALIPATMTHIKRFGLSTYGDRFAYCTFNHFNDRTYMCSTPANTNPYIVLSSGHMHEPILPATILSLLMYFVFKNGCSKVSLSIAFNLLCDKLGHCPLFFPNDFDLMKFKEMHLCGIQQHEFICDRLIMKNTDFALNSMPLFASLIDRSALILTFKLALKSDNNQRTWQHIVHALSLFLSRQSLHMCDRSLNDRWNDALSWAEGESIVHSESASDRRMALSIELQFGYNANGYQNTENTPTFNSDININHNRLIVTLLSNFGILLSHLLERFTDSLLLTHSLRLGHDVLSNYDFDTFCRHLLENVLSSLLNVNVIEKISDSEEAVMLIKDIEQLKYYNEITKQFSKFKPEYLSTLVLLKADVINEY